MSIGLSLEDSSCVPAVFHSRYPVPFFDDTAGQPDGGVAWCHIWIVVWSYRFLPFSGSVGLGVGLLVLLVWIYYYLFFIFYLFFIDGV